MKINYTNDKKINNLIEEKRDLKLAKLTFVSLVIISEAYTIYSPDSICTFWGIINTIGAGIFATAENEVDKKIKKYKEKTKNG